MQTENQPERIIRKKELCERTGLSYPTIFRKYKAGEFPAPVKLSEKGRGVGWLNSELESWLRSRPRVA